jgi:hypothetical protein
MNKKAYAFFLKKNRPRNRIAQELSDGRYQPRVVKDKTKYSRKDKHGKTDRYNWDSNSS